MFAGTVGLAYPMCVALVSLLRPIRTMQQITEDLEQKVRVPFEMEVRAAHQGVCHELYKLVYKMAKEVDLWQERFDLLLDTNLCEDCIVEKDRLY
jgi:Ni2+-binding GTPase involved in maturation of urease and hydrogenase